jgi:hypothetical protein
MQQNTQSFKHFLEFSIILRSRLNASCMINQIYGLVMLTYSHPAQMESCNICFCVTGTYKDGLSPSGYVLSDHMLLGSVVATILVIVVTAQVSFQVT